MTNNITDCGHKPSPHSGFTTGTAICDGKQVCWGCAYKIQLDKMSKSKIFTAYVDMGAEHITTWDGQQLARIYITRKTHRFGNPRYYIKATDYQGSKWWGLTQGQGMYINLHKLV